MAGSPPCRTFSDSELAAAEQLIQLSSSGDTGGFGGGGAALQQAVSSSSSSPLSVGTRLAPAVPAVEEDEEACVGPQRRAHRYRMIEDIYAATKPVAARPRKRSSAPRHTKDGAKPKPRR